MRYVLAYAVVPLAAVTAGPAIAALGPGSVGLPPTAGSTGLRYAGVPAIVTGLGLAAWTAWTFASVGETLSPIVVPDRLVTAGPLQWIRNPLYLGIVLAVSGEAILLASSLVGVYAAALWGVYHAIVVWYEEPKLQGAFGDAYDTYCERTPRWIPAR